MAGGRLAHAPAERGHEVRRLVRDRGKASTWRMPQASAARGDVLDPGRWRAVVGVDIADTDPLDGPRSKDDDLAERNAPAARRAAMASEEGAGRVASNT